MNLHIEEKGDSDFVFYIDGDLQFDTADEAIYHESMALPALAIAQSRKPERKDDLHVLICGGGDGLALRECLRFPGVTRVDLVDYSPEVVELGRTRFAVLNCRAFEDPRTNVHIRDAWEFLINPPIYDVILCDFTIPRRPDDTHVFSREWYDRVKSALAPHGVANINGLSPEISPLGFWCLKKTINSAGLNPLPFRVCIPSFREKGFGVWSQFLASRTPVTIAHLRSLECPVETKQVDLSKLWRGASFSRVERSLEKSVPVHTIASPCLLRLILNNNSIFSSASAAAVECDLTSDSLVPGAETYDLNDLMKAIPISHPYHTREMIESMAGEVIGVVRKLDIEKLINALLKKSSELPSNLLLELHRLKAFLQERVFNFQTFSLWSRRLFAMLVMLMTLANTIMPDNAFAKGSLGLGHSSMSRGYSSASGRSGSSFGGSRSFGGSFGNRGAFGSPGKLSSSRPFSGERTFTGQGYRRSYQSHAQPADIYGNVYPVRIYRYDLDYDYVYGNGNGGVAATRPTRPQPISSQPSEQRAAFIADDDMSLLENGDTAVDLSDSSYLLVNRRGVSLMNRASAAPLLLIYTDPNLIGSIRESLQQQRDAAKEELNKRKDWLSWVGWTSALFSVVREDENEVLNIQALIDRIEKGLNNLPEPLANASTMTIAPEDVELFAGSAIRNSRMIQIRKPDNAWLSTDGEDVWDNDVAVRRHPIPPLLKQSLKGILTKLDKEFAGDLAALENDYKELAQEKLSLDKDHSEYLSLSSSNGGDYEVDYGTDSISAQEAINRTEADQKGNADLIAQTQAEGNRLGEERAGVRLIMTKFE